MLIEMGFVPLEIVNRMGHESVTDHTGYLFPSLPGQGATACRPIQPIPKGNAAENAYRFKVIKVRTYF